MSNPHFDFKRFRVCHDRCAMKVGTDAVVLSCWADLCGSRRVLDVGTGTGVMALIAAQRLPEAEVVGIDIDAASVIQARENVASSPFSERVGVLLCDVRTFADVSGFDCILCNPPFFTEDTLPPEFRRSVARNSSSLPFPDLLHSVRRLLRPLGRLHVVLPAQVEPEFTRLAFVEGLCLRRVCRVHTTSRKPAKRVLLTFSPLPDGCLSAASTGFSHAPEFEDLVLMEDGHRSASYQRLTADFYLDSPPAS